MSSTHIYTLHTQYTQYICNTKAQADNSYYGIAIGFVVLSGALVIGNVSGACFNPAVAMLTLLQGDFNDLWVFLVAPLIGGCHILIRFTPSSSSQLLTLPPLPPLLSSPLNRRRPRWTCVSDYQPFGDGGGDRGGWRKGDATRRYQRERGASLRRPQTPVLFLP
jgi:hypothetical protein